MESEEKTETITLRVTVSFKKEIDEARGETDRAEFCRKAIKSYMEKPHEIHGISYEIAPDVIELQMRLSVLQKELEVKNELLREREARIKDLQFHSGYLQAEFSKVSNILALPVHEEEEKEKKHWWQRRKKD